MKNIHVESWRCGLEFADMERSHSGSFCTEFLSKAARCNTQLGRLRFDWQWDSICWVGLQGCDALPAGLMHSSSQRDSHLLNPHLWIIDITLHLKLSLYFPGHASQIFQCEHAILCAQVGKKNVVMKSVQLEACKIGPFFFFFGCSETWIVGVEVWSLA